ncbi:hypothetical protein OO256_26600 [Pseudomonas sp. DCB_CB]|uniref:hypothetical protein n=1 Tax=unclassified Pseudomonas TaxID=196821 RepID=UPI002248D4AB|nr:MULTISPECIES: hypothetical protein [unclassified Pseudomonas]MCX2694515.1 hypothetical protein [Pseudomonas sp. DCB_BZ]MCX2859655.1 hypothetical protein [Pseudomonas sp. DCB_CB]
MFNKVICASVIIAGALLAGCNEKAEDGRQIVPTVSDASKPVVDGVTLTPKQFLERFCTGSAVDKNGTCPSVQREMVKQSTQGELPKGW